MQDAISELLVDAEVFQGLYPVVRGRCSIINRECRESVDLLVSDINEIHTKLRIPSVCAAELLPEYCCCCRLKADEFKCV